MVIAKKYWQQLYQRFMLLQTEKKKFGFMQQVAHLQGQGFIEWESQNI